MLISLKKLKIDNLRNLKELFLINYPKHLNTTSIIQVFIERIQKYPQWIERVEFLVNDDDSWRTNGVFILIIDGSKIYFDTLEDAPYKELQSALMSLKFNETATFINISDRLRELLLKIIRIKHLKIIHDIGTIAYLMSKDYLMQLVDLPEGFVLRPVSIKDAPLINSLWAGKHHQSESFIKELIKYNPSLGLYNGDECMASFLSFDSGAMGVGISKYPGKYYGTLVFLMFAKQLAKDTNRDVHFEVVHGNTVVQEKSEFISKVYDTNSWISIQKMKKLDSAPTWGHL